MEYHLSHARSSSSFPFTRPEFLGALERSGSVGPQTGWEPVVFDGNLFSFIKSHSYGEYIFDWEWARAFEHSGEDYYPKLTSMVPFSPVNTSHFVRGFGESAFTEYERFYQDGPFSSSHFLFLGTGEEQLFGERGYLLRHSFQYHFLNEGYDSFEHFLTKLKGRKAKQLRREREFPGLTVEALTGEQLGLVHGEEMYQFYSATIDEKGAIGYLRKSFFDEIFRTMRENILYVRARRAEETIAGALFFFDDRRLYGRYWGAREEVPFLHFELCYYQGIDFCLSRGLEAFEAGAQGEHKILRGFRPTLILSAHQIKHVLFSRAIRNYIDQEKQHVRRTMEELGQWLPFKTS